ncbi:MAG: biopolymer transporter ExbD [Verrucomicrobiota bacterium]
MRLESTLSDRAGLLYTAPLVDVILLLLVFFLFSSNFVIRSGISVELPRSSSSLPSAQEAHIITLAPGMTPQLFFNDGQISFEALEETLGEARVQTDQVILLADRNIDYGTVMVVSEAVLKFGYELSHATLDDTDQ